MKKITLLVMLLIALNSMVTSAKAQAYRETGNTEKAAIFHTYSTTNVYQHGGYRHRWNRDRHHHHGRRFKHRHRRRRDRF